MDKMRQGRISIEITDYTESKDNLSLTLSKDIYFPLLQVIIIEVSRSFAVAFGWPESLVREIFG